MYVLTIMVQSPKLAEIHNAHFLISFRLPVSILGKVGKIG